MFKSEFSRLAFPSFNIGWPLTAMLVGTPLWWALGIEGYMSIVLAIPMIRHMAAWARNDRHIKAPPGFSLWVLFLVIMIFGILTITLTPPETVSSPISHRLVSYATRTLQYAAATVVLLYAGNLTQEEFPREKLARLLGVVALYTTAGGVAGMLAPNFHLTSPFVFLVPHTLNQISFIHSILHPGLAEVMNVLGTSSARPDAPFAYTNTWGSAVVILVPWLLVGWWRNGTPRERRLAFSVAIITIIPFLHSLDRGAWIGAMVALFYIGVRLALRGKALMLAAIVTTVASVSLIIAATPLQHLIAARLHHGASNGIRTAQALATLKVAASSPLIGYGDTRKMKGSPASITLGPTSSCPACGQADIGSNGQLWLLLVCNGYLGAFLYLSFFGYGIWRYRHDITPLGIPGVLALILNFVFMFVYISIGPILIFTMLSYSLLWRNEPVNYGPLLPKVLALHKAIRSNILEDR